MQVRQAAFFDVAKIADLMKAHRKEVDAQSTLIFDKHKCIEGLCHAIGGESDLLFVAHECTEVIGYLWLSIIQPHFCNEYYAAEQYLYVRPERRNSRAMFLLLKEAEKAALTTGCEFLQLGVTSDINRVDKTYNKRYRRAGTIYHIPTKGI